MGVVDQADKTMRANILFPKGWIQFDLGKYGSNLRSETVAELARQDATILLDEYENSALVVDLTGVKEIGIPFLDAFLGNMGFMRPGRTFFFQSSETDTITEMIQKAIAGQLQIIQQVVMA